MTTTPQGPCCPRISLSGYFSSTSDVTANELLSYLEYEVGVDWDKYFYCEFPCALRYWEAAYKYMVELKKARWTTYELADHPIYGYFVNVVDYHPALGKLGYWLDSREDSKHWDNTWVAIAAH